MVKGVSKRVVVVKSSDGELFEQALFIVNEEKGAGQGRGEVLREACRLAEKCARSAGKKTPINLKSHLLAAAAGAGATGLAWLATLLF